MLYKPPIIMHLLLATTLVSHLACDPLPAQVEGVEPENNQQAVIALHLRRHLESLGYEVITEALIDPDVHGYSMTSVLEFGQTGFKLGRMFYTPEETPEEPVTILETLMAAEPDQESVDILWVKQEAFGARAREYSLAQYAHGSHGILMFFRAADPDDARFVYVSQGAVQEVPFQSGNEPIDGFVSQLEGNGEVIYITVQSHIAWEFRLFIVEETPEGTVEFHQYWENAVPTNGPRSVLFEEGGWHTLRINRNHQPWILLNTEPGPFDAFDHQVSLDPWDGSPAFRARINLTDTRYWLSAQGVSDVIRFHKIRNAIEWEPITSNNPPRRYITIHQDHPDSQTTRTGVVRFGEGVIHSLLERYEDGRFSPTHLIEQAHDISTGDTISQVQEAHPTWGPIDIGIGEPVTCQGSYDATLTNTRSNGARQIGRFTIACQTDRDETPILGYEEGLRVYFAFVRAPALTFMNE